MSQELDQERGTSKGELVLVRSVRGRGEKRVMVTAGFKPFTVKGKTARQAEALKTT